MVTQKINKILYLVLFILNSCISTEELLNSNQIYTGMTASTFCQKVLMTTLNEDPCIGKRDFYPTKKVMVLSGENENKFFIFDNVSNKNINLNTARTSKLVLITSSIDEVEFFITNFIN
jgi:hypothetical protein